MASHSSHARWFSRSLATIAYAPLLLAPIALTHTLVFLLPWSALHVPALAGSPRFHLTMIGAGWLFGTLTVAAFATWTVRRHAPPPPDTLFRALTCSAHAPAGVVWLSRDAITLCEAGIERTVPLAEVEHVAVDTGWRNLVGVFFWRERYPITLRLRDGTSLSLFVFAARAFAAAVGDAKRGETSFVAHAPTRA